MSNRLYGVLPDEFTPDDDLYPYEWDVWCGDRPLDLYRISKYPHGRRGGGEILDLWACTRGEDPTRESLSAYCGDGVAWGIHIEEGHYFRPGNGFHKNSEYRSTVTAWILRNGCNFYRVSMRSIDGAFAEARYKMFLLQEHPIPFHQIGWEDRLRGRPVFWRGVPCVVDRSDGEGQVYLRPEGYNLFPPSAWARTDEEQQQWLADYGDGLWTDLLDSEINWFREVKDGGDPCQSS